MTDYMDFHPGGDDELMRGVGKDATQLFDEVREKDQRENFIDYLHLQCTRGLRTVNIAHQIVISEKYFK